METGTTLADQFAGLRASPTTPNADTTILSAAVHAMIAAIFVRIFARLEQFLLLWQAGQLPLAGHHAATEKPGALQAPTRPTSAARPHATRRRAARTRLMSDHADPVADRIARIPATTAHPLGQGLALWSRRAAIAAPPPPIARAPPRKTPRAASNRHAHNVTISKQLTQNPPDRSRVARSRRLHRGGGAA